MGLPTEPVTLSVEQINDINQKLSIMRHDVNNHLSLILAAVELVRHKPELLKRMLETLAGQAPKIGASISGFSGELERTLGITRS
jgi:hypothetical protein